MDTQHAESVRTLQAQVSDYYSRKVPYRVYHGSTNSTRILTFKRNEMIDTSKLNRVLSVDTNRKVAVVEPNVSMDKLVNATLKFGLIPTVVPEFPGITIGGAIQGAGAETSSHKYGCVSQTINWMEYILGDGSVIKTSRTEHADLFYGSAGSCGSLGLITAAEVNLIQAPKYVHVTHYQIKSFAEGINLMKKYALQECDFIEWIMFRKDHGTIVVGTMSDEVRGKIRRFSRPQDQWYYLYLKQIADAGTSITDSVPIKDYLFRFNRGAYWAAELAFKQSGVPFNALTRFILDPWLRTRKLYQALQASAASQSYMCQDLVLPEETVIPFLEFIDREFAMYPIGGCPIMPEARSPLQCNGIESKIVFNIGVYGLRVEPYEEFVKATRLIEAETRKFGGKKWLYAHNYYSESEFWKIYDKKWYFQLRNRYKAETLPGIYDRTRVKEHFKISKKRGAIKTILGIAKLRITD
jgi:delta24-sterol reductase